MSTANRKIDTDFDVLFQARNLTLKRAIASEPAFEMGAAGMVILLTPPGEAPQDYAMCAAAFLMKGLGPEDYKSVGWLVVRASDKAAKITSEFEDECAHKTRVIIISDTLDLPATVVIAADGFIQLDPISPDDLRSACQTALGLNVTAKQAEALLAYPRDLMVSALRRYRPVAESLRRLKAYKQVPAGTPILEATPRLQELHGYGDAKEWGLQLATDLKRWKNGKLRWSEIDCGLLLSGPPGVGKTIFARALAATCDVHFIATSLGQWQAKGSLDDLLKAMRADFAAAALNAPSIILIDELDSVGSRAAFTGDYATYSTQVVNGLLECLDGAGNRNGVIVIGATNYPQKIDPAVLRPGRLDRHVQILLPNESDRLAILRQQLGEDRVSDLSALGPGTEGLAGADLAQVVRDAKRLARREGRSVVVSDLLSLLPQMIKVTGDYRRSVTLHEAGHTIVGAALSYGKFLHAFVRHQLNPRFALQSAGSAAFQKPSLQHCNAQYYRNEICIRLSGMAAESLILSSHGDGSGAGPGSDLAEATGLALQMELKLGMGRGLAHVGKGTELDMFGLQAVPWLASRIETILAEEMRRAKEILSAQMPLLLRLASELDATGYLSAAKFQSVQDEVSEQGAVPVVLPTGDKHVARGAQL